jgi:preprotein translocase subunit SecG
MISVLAVIQVILSISLCALVLMHSQGGTHIVERNLTRLTVIVAILFAINCVLLFRQLR